MGIEARKGLFRIEFCIENSDWMWASSTYLTGKSSLGILSLGRGNLWKLEESTCWCEAVQVFWSDEVARKIESDFKALPVAPSHDQVGSVILRTVRMPNPFRGRNSTEESLDSQLLKLLSRLHKVYRVLVSLESQELCRTMRSQECNSWLFSFPALSIHASMHREELIANRKRPSRPVLWSVDFSWPLDCPLVQALLDFMQLDKHFICISLPEARKHH